MAPSDRSAAEKRPLNAGYDDQPEAYDDLRAAGHMTRRRIAYFEQVLDEVPGRVLELGSGTGALLRRLASTHPTGASRASSPCPTTSTSPTPAPAPRVWATCASRWGPARCCHPSWPTPRSTC